MKRKLLLIGALVFSLTLALTGCFGEGPFEGAQDEEFGDFRDFADDYEWTDDCYACGRSVPAMLQLDLYDATGVATLENENKAVSAAGAYMKNQSTAHYESYDAVYQEAVKFLSDGSIQKFLKDPAADALGNDLDKFELPPLPDLRFIGISPTEKYVYLLFEWPFFYNPQCLGRDESEDIFSNDSDCTCQFFVLVDDDGFPMTLDEATAKQLGTYDSIAVGSEREDLLEGAVNDFITDVAPDHTNLACIDPGKDIQGDMNEEILQFDVSDCVYYRASVWDHWREVLYKWCPQSLTISQYTTQQIDEVINANIDFRDVVVTHAGDVFYTGESCTDQYCAGDDTFFRVALNTDELIEISRGYWQYIFAPVKQTTAEKAAGEKTHNIYFYGPNPITSESAGLDIWDTSCLYEFDPSAGDDNSDRTEVIAECNNDIWRYVDNVDTEPERKERCVETKAFLGGGEVSKIVQTLSSDETARSIYAVGNIRIKGAGTWTYSLDYFEGHCVKTENSADGSETVYTFLTNEDAAADGDECGDGGTEKTYGNWYDGLSDETCFMSDGTTTVACSLADSATYTNDEWNFGWSWCKDPYDVGDSWARSYQALISVDPDTLAVTMASETTEEVIDAVVIENVVYYTSYQNGNYFFSKHTDDANTPLTEGIEFYNIQPAPEPGKAVFDGLRFSDNQYLFGKIDLTTGDITDESAAITGRVKTFVIFDAID